MIHLYYLSRHSVLVPTINSWSSPLFFYSLYHIKLYLLYCILCTFTFSLFICIREKRKSYCNYKYFFPQIRVELTGYVHQSIFSQVRPILNLVSQGNYAETTAATWPSPYLSYSSRLIIFLNLNNHRPTHTCTSSPEAGFSRNDTWKNNKAFKQRTLQASYNTWPWQFSLQVTVLYI